MPANSSVQSALDDAQSAASASTARFEQAMDELKERAGKVAQETISTLKSRAEPYVSDAGERLALRDQHRSVRQHHHAPGRARQGQRQTEHARQT